MKIRLARLTDFEVYKKLYDDWECNMLYRSEESDIKPQTNEETDLFGEFDEATKEYLKKVTERTIEKFTKNLSAEWYKDKRIYIFEEAGEVIGFAELFKCVGTRWKLEEVCFFEEYRSQEAFTTAMNLLIKMANIKSIDVCVIYDSCKKRVMAAGFAPHSVGFFKKERSKES